MKTAAISVIAAFCMWLIAAVAFRLGMAFALHKAKTEAGLKELEKALGIK